MAAPINCPTCGRPIDWSQAPFRPFCSERCKLIDLGAWLNEGRAIPGESSAAGSSGESAASDKAEHES